MDVNDVVQPSVLIKKLLEKKIAPIMKEYDLRIVELDILFFLSKDEHLDTAKEIMQKKHLSKAHISKSIDNLKKRNLIRISEDAHDHRILHIALDESAYEVVDKVMKVYAECLQTIHKGITEEEWETVHRVLHKMLQNIEEAI